jgi:hypothetical protein
MYIVTQYVVGVKTVLIGRTVLDRKALSAHTMGTRREARGLPV